MYQTLYRKWRPKRFEDVVGQDHVTTVLRYEVAHKQTSHAYLFCGSRGTGKTTCAKILAKALNCQNPQDGDPCGICDVCRGIENGSIIDVIEMDAASNNGIDDIREIRESVDFVPAETTKRVYIIDEVHMLSQSAFNALLKTLEEPPEHVVFILATTELQKIPATILSRCQRFDFRRIDTEMIVARLLEIAHAEHISITHDALYLIARAANGGMRDAIGMLEVCGAGSLGSATITEGRAAELIGVSDTDTMQQLLEAILATDYEAIFSTVDRVFRGALDAEAFWTNFMCFYRDLFVLRTTMHPQEHLDIPPERIPALTALACRFSKEQFLAHFSILDATLATLQANRTSKRIAVETGLIQLTDLKLRTDTDSMLARIAALEARVQASTAACVRPVDPGILPTLPGKLHGEPTSQASSKAASNTVSQAVLQPDSTMEKFLDWPEVISHCNNAAGLAAMLRRCQAFINTAHTSVRIYAPDAITFSMISAPEANGLLYQAIRSQEGFENLLQESIVYSTDSPPEIADVLDELV